MKLDSDPDAKQHYCKLDYQTKCLNGLLVIRSIFALDGVTIV
jgi:hypothetical protein